MTAAGAVTRPQNYADLPTVARETFVLLDTLSLRVDSTNTKRGFDLVTPARLTLGDNNAVHLDSLVLAHSDTGRLSLSGGVDSSGVLQGLLKLDRIPLSDIGLLSQNPSLRAGRINAFAEATGTREQPKIDANVAVRDAILVVCDSSKLTFAVFTTP